MSDLLDRLVSEARGGGWAREATLRSVVGTIEIAPDDPDLSGADEAIRALFPRPGGRKERPRRRLRASG